MVDGAATSVREYAGETASGSKQTPRLLVWRACSPVVYIFFSYEGSVGWMISLKLGVTTTLQLFIYFYV